MYVLGNPPRTPNDAFDVLENVFGSEEFSAVEAVSALSEVLEKDTSEAQRELNQLVRMNAIEEI